MIYLLQETNPSKNGVFMYVGSHWKTGCQLQIEENAYQFPSKNEAETCRRNLYDYCGMSLRIIEKN